LIFIDSNVPMYLVGGEHPHKLDVQRILGRLAGEQRPLVTSSEVFQELLYRYVSAGRRDWVGVAFDALQSIVDDVFAVEKDDVLLAKDIVNAHPDLAARDAVHIAVMRRRKISVILSFDGGFEGLAGISRLPAPVANG
jgi:predicted nucleic acid-binding protein